MWCAPRVWASWQSRFEQAGYDCTALTLPGHEAGAADGQLERKGLGDYVSTVVAAAAQAVRPVLVGHSMGGLIAQLAASQLQLTAAVLVNSAAPAPVFPLRPVMLPGLVRHFARWGLWRKAFRLSPREARHLLFNGMPAAEQVGLHAMLGAESGRVAYQLGFGALNLAGSNRVDRDAITCPMLALAGAQDHIVPVAVSRSMAVWYAGALEYREYAQHAHWMLGEPGWQQRADEVLTWLQDRPHRA